MTGRSQPSQCDRVLEVLADGREHSVTEIHARAGTMRLNSRVAELRSKRGLTIVCHRGGGDYRYQLVPTAITPLDESEAACPSLSSSGDRRAARHAAPFSGPLAEPDPTIPSRPSTDGSGSGSASGVGTLGLIAPVLPDVAHLEAEHGQLVLVAA